MSTLGKMDEESTERDKKQTKIISGSAHLENKWLHIASYPSFFWAVCAALRRLQAIDVGGCWIAKWISNWTFCVQGRLHAVLPHTKTLAVFPSTNPRDRTRLWARVARVQAASGVKAQEDGLLPRWWPTPFPAWPCCYRFNPPVAAVPPSPPPLLRLPPSDSEVLVDDCSINRHPFLIAPPPKKTDYRRVDRYTLVPSEHPFRHDSRENTTFPLVSARHIPSSCEFLIPPTAARQTIKPRERPSSPHIARSPPPHPASAVCWAANPRCDSGSRPVHGRRRIAPDESQGRLPFPRCHRAVDPRTSRWLPAMRP